MKNTIFLFSAIISLWSCQNQAQPKQVNESETAATMSKETIYQFKVKTLEGGDFDFSTLKGKKNTCSKYSFKMWINATI